MRYVDGAASLMDAQIPNGLEKASRVNWLLRNVTPIRFVKS